MGYRLGFIIFLWRVLLLPVANRLNSAPFQVGVIDMLM